MAINYPIKLSPAYRLSLIFLSFFFTGLYAQTIPPERVVDWTKAGVREWTDRELETYHVMQHGFSADGSTPNDQPMEELMSQVSFDAGAIIKFPTGEFLFHEPIILKNHTFIQGDGAEKTTLIFDLGGNGHSIVIEGESGVFITHSLSRDGFNGDSLLLLTGTAELVKDQWINITVNDTDLVTSEWAEYTVGQIIQIKDISEDTVFLKSNLRLNIPLEREPLIQLIHPRSFTGVSCLKLLRKDNTAPQQSSNIFLRYAVNSTIENIESENCTYSHVLLRSSSNNTISGSYLHDGFEFGGGGRAYGVMVDFTSGENLMENNIFRKLRHAMIVQAGANGNVFAYNYSTEPFWSTIPSDAAGDMVMHGNFPFANLFEHNIGRNIVIDNSHGPNGPYNTFLRNRADGYGIFFSAENSPGQNFLGNVITNTNFPYNLVNYTILGENHYLEGNCNKGQLTPPGTGEDLPSSLAYNNLPEYLDSSEWAQIGPQCDNQSAVIPAQYRYETEQYTYSCTATASENVSESTITIFPNPAKDQFYIQSKHDPIIKLVVNDLAENIVQKRDLHCFQCTLYLHDLPAGIYFLRLYMQNNHLIIKKIVKH